MHAIVCSSVAPRSLSTTHTVIVRQWALSNVSLRCCWPACCCCCAASLLSLLAQPSLQHSQPPPSCRRSTQLLLCDPPGHRIQPQPNHLSPSPPQLACMVRTYVCREMYIHRSQPITGRRCAPPWPSKIAVHSTLRVWMSGYVPTARPDRWCMLQDVHVLIRAAAH